MCADVWIGFVRSAPPLGLGTLGHDARHLARAVFLVTVQVLGRGGDRRVTEGFFDGHRRGAAGVGGGGARMPQ